MMLQYESGLKVEWSRRTCVPWPRSLSRGKSWATKRIGKSLFVRLFAVILTEIDSLHFQLHFRM